MDSPPELGPSVDADLVEYVIVGVPELSALDEVATALAELVRLEAIRILDLVTLVKSDDGTVEVLEVEDVDSLRALGTVGGYVGGLLSSNDLDLAGEAVSPGTVAILLLAEDRWAGPLSVAARSAGGRVLAGERVLRSRISQALADAVLPLGTPDREVDDARQGEIREDRLDLLVRTPPSWTTSETWLRLLIDPAAQVRELDDLRGQGLLTTEEFERQRRKVLGP